MSVKNHKFQVAFFLSLLLLAACSKSNEGDSSGLKNITFEQAEKMILSDNPPIIIDVRTPEEFNGELGHLPGARLIPMQLTADSLNVYREMKDREILLVCRSGRRSGIVGKELVNEGFENVYNLLGGMKGWNANGGAVERSR